VSQCDLDLA